MLNIIRLLENSSYLIRHKEAGQFIKFADLTWN